MVYMQPLIFEHRVKTIFTIDKSTSQISNTDTKKTILRKLNRFVTLEIDTLYIIELHGKGIKENH